MWDVIMLSGVHAWQDSGQSMKTLDLGHHWGVQWGGRKSLWVSKVCGVTILIRKGFATREHVLEYFCPPAAIQGRAGGLRLRTTGQPAGSAVDIALFVVYFAPTHYTRYEDIANRVTSWVEHCCDRTATRTTPIVGGDINSQLGQKRAFDGFPIECEGTTVGQYGGKIENHNGRMFRQFCENSHLDIVTTHWDCGPTYHARKGTPARSTTSPSPLEPWTWWSAAPRSEGRGRGSSSFEAEASRITSLWASLSTSARWRSFEQRAEQGNQTETPS